MLQPIPIKFLPRTILPCAFDESMSYYEMLCALLYKQKEIIEQLNIHDTNIKELTKSINNINDIIFKILTRIIKIETTLENLDVKATITNPLTGSEDNIENIINMICEKLCKCNGDTPIDNKNGITANDFDNLIINCSVYDSLNINANDFDTNSDNLLNNYKKESEEA